MNKFIEEDLKYCPQCKEEYRSDIIQCADCATELITGKQLLTALKQKKDLKANRDMNIKPEDELVDVRKGPIRDIKQTQTLLESHGIPAVIVKDKSCGKGCCGPDVLLKVRATDLHEAASVFENEYKNSTALHEHDTSYSHSVFNAGAGETTCPACGFTFSTQSTTCPDCGLCFA